MMMMDTMDTSQSQPMDVAPAVAVAATSGAALVDFTAAMVSMAATAEAESAESNNNHIDMAEYKEHRKNKKRNARSGSARARSTGITNTVTGSIASIDDIATGIGTRSGIGRDITTIQRTTTPTTASTRPPPRRRLRLPLPRPRRPSNTWADRLPPRPLIWVVERQGRVQP